MEKIGIETARRSFIKSLGVSTLALPSCTHFFGKPIRRQRVVVVGAGLAGLTAAYELKKKGVRANIYEGSDRLGGCVLSNRDVIKGAVVELGGEAIDSKHHSTLKLCKELNLKLVNRISQRHTKYDPVYYFGGQKYTSKEIAKEYWPYYRKIKTDAHKVGRDSAALAKIDRMSADEYMESIRMPKRLRHILGSILLAFYGTDSQNQSALQLLWLAPGIVGGKFNPSGNSDERFRVANGNDSIAQRLSIQLKDQIETRRRLIGVRQKLSHVELIFDDLEVHAELAVLALPLSTMKRVDLKPGISEKWFNFIEQVPYGQAMRTVTAARTHFWRRSRTSGEYLTDLPFQWAYDANNDAHPAVVSFFVSGSKAMNLEKTDANRGAENFYQDLGKVDRYAYDQFKGRAATSSWNRSQWSLGVYSTFEPGQYSRHAKNMYSGNPASLIDHRIIFSGSHLSDEHYGYMNGAIETGKAAAKAVLRYNQLQHA